MGDTQNISQYNLKVHKAKVGYLAELFIKVNQEDSKYLNDIELILIVDRSGLHV